jgi:large subunit ribosomal protein L19
MRVPYGFKLKINNHMKQELLQYVDTLTTVNELPAFKAGDTVTVSYKIREGNKERIQQFQGVVLQRVGSGVTATFTVRKMSGGIGVERIFPMNSPFIEKVEVNKRGLVRRARIFYLRKLTGKKARIKERTR